MLAKSHYVISAEFLRSVFVPVVFRCEVASGRYERAPCRVDRNSRFALAAAQSVGLRGNSD